VQESECAAIGFAEPRPVDLCLLQKNKRALNVGADERLGRGDGAVHMAFRRKVNNGPGLMLAQQRTYKFRVAYVAAGEQITRIPLQRRQIGWVARIGQKVQVDDGRSRGPDPAQDKIRADKTCSACDQYGILHLVAPR
jgi:hypothetical protein